MSEVPLYRRFPESAFVQRNVHVRLAPEAQGRRPLIRLMGTILPVHPGRDVTLSRVTTRAEDAQGTPTQRHISPRILVYEAFAGNGSS